MQSLSVDFTILGNLSDSNLPYDDNSSTKVNAQHVIRRLKIDDPLLSAIYIDVSKKNKTKRPYATSLMQLISDVQV